jgi:nitrogen fixation/metabolism regulation signal transduction histidine kinase
MASRVTRPVAQLAEAAREVAAGNWHAQVQVDASDELGEMANAFNRMTRELTEQRERLVQAERVAAWRELARRLAHELKNPLFPLQITVENLLKAREHGGEQFDEVFRESASTLLAEIANLKAIIGRFSEFSKMPQPQLQVADINELVRNVLQVHQAQLSAEGKPAIAAELKLDDKLRKVAADPELLHRALANLVLNAIDAMPQGGTLTLRTRAGADSFFIEVSDTGTGLSKEECDRLFTPYYTSKEHGTGLGLAIAQSVVSDHHGRIAVKSARGQGTTFVIELPRGLEGAAQFSARTG